MLVYHRDPGVLQLFGDLFPPPYQVHCVTSVAALQDSLRTRRPDVVFVDWPDRDPATIACIKNLFSRPPANRVAKIALTTRFPWPPELETEFDAVVHQPFSIATVYDAVSRLVPEPMK